MILPLPQLLLTKTQSGDQSTIAVDVLLAQIVQKVPALADHLQQAAAAVVVVDMGAQMISQLVDAVGQNGNLNLGGTGVALMGRILFDDLVFDFFPNHCVFHLSEYIARILSSGRGDTGFAGCIPQLGDWACPIIIPPISYL